MSRLILQSGEGHGQSFELEQGINRLGRATDNDVVIQGASLSNHHCELILTLDQARVRDKGSTNGTFIDGRQIEDASLAHGQILQLGDQPLLFEVVTADVHIPEMEAFQPSASQPLPDGSWSCLHHYELKALWRCTHCLQMYCNTCVHHLRRLKGKYLHLCPQCSYPCELLDADKFRQKKSWLESVKKFFGK